MTIVIKNSCWTGLTLLAVLAQPLLAAEDSAFVWQRYDETADLTELAQHESQRMHFKLLNSLMLDKRFLR